MKAAKLFFILPFFFFSCSGNKNKTGTDTLTSITIPGDSLPVKLDSAPSDHTQVVVPVDSIKVKEVAVNEGMVFYTLPYCGGARPTEEILAEKKKAKPLTNSTLKLKNKSGDYLVVTNEKGLWRSGIPAGTYDVYLTEKTNKAIYDVKPGACENCLKEKMATITIKQGVRSDCTVHFNCGPDAKRRP